jgi:serine/threonine-protein kinase HipA
MQRRAAIEHRQGLRSSAQLTELDYLLGVHDACRMGGMRFKRATQAESDDTAFLDNSVVYAAPPMTSLRELAQAAHEVEQDEHSTQMPTRIGSPYSLLRGHPLVVRDPRRR